MYKVVDNPASAKRDEWKKADVAEIGFDYTLGGFAARSQRAPFDFSVRMDGFRYRTPGHTRASPPTVSRAAAWL